MKIENKFPGKDVSHEDMETKFPLVAKKNDSHKSKFTISGGSGNDLNYHYCPRCSVIIYNKPNYKLHIITNGFKEVTYQP